MSPGLLTWAPVSTFSALDWGMIADQFRALEEAEGLAATSKNIERVGRLTSPESAAWAFTQWSLRRRAKAKFSRAEAMLFDRDGLEMSSHEEVARGANAWDFPPGRIADLTTGIGGDLIWLSQGREAVGFETDAVRAEYARHNLSVYGADAEVTVGDCTSLAWDAECAFADPARRSVGGRTLDPSAFDPSVDWLVQKMRSLRQGRIKLTPMLDDDFLSSLGPDRVFVEHHGECKECLVILGRDVPRVHQGVWSLRVPQGERLPGEVPLKEIVDEPQEYVFEVGPAAVRSHGLGCFGLPGLGDSNGYLTGKALGSPLSAFGVRWHGPWRPGAVRSALRGLGARVGVVKSRGTGLDVQEAARLVRSEGRTELTLLLYPLGRQVKAVLAERVT